MAKAGLLVLAQHLPSAVLRPIIGLHLSRVAAIAIAAAAAAAAPAPAACGGAEVAPHQPVIGALVPALRQQAKQAHVSKSLEEVSLRRRDCFEREENLPKKLRHDAAAGHMRIQLHGARAWTILLQFEQPIKADTVRRCGAILATGRYVAQENFDSSKPAALTFH